MNTDILKGQWKEFKGKLRERWGDLTDDDVEEINGNSEQLIGKLQQRYGMARDRATTEVNSWLEKANEKMDRS